MRDHCTGTISCYQRGCRRDTCRALEAQRRRELRARQRAAQTPTPPRSDDMSWTDRAACRNEDPELFFPERGEDTGTAKAICASCSVRAECLEYALENGEQFGIWGGKSERQRRGLRRARNLAIRSTA